MIRDEVLNVLREYLAVDVQADQWDEVPELSLILRGTDGIPSFEQMPVGVEVWTRAPVHQVLWAVAETTKMVTQRGWQWLQPGEELLGVAMFSEGWGVSSQVKDGEFDALRAY